MKKLKFVEKHKIDYRNLASNIRYSISLTLENPFFTEKENTENLKKLIDCFEIAVEFEERVNGDWKED